METGKYRWLWLVCVWGGWACGGEGLEPVPLSSPEGMETVAVLETTQGPVTLRFFPEEAPEHVRNFLTLCNNGFYDGTYFHRVAPGFMIQGGDPLTRNDDPENDGQGGYTYRGPGTTLKAEFNSIPHRRGIVSMARAADPHSAGSQFFIMVEAEPKLDGRYTVFGEVVDGMDAVDRIVQQPGAPIPGAGGFRPFERQYIEKCRLEQRPVP